MSLTHTGVVVGQLKNKIKRWKIQKCKEKSLFFEKVMNLKKYM